MYSLQQEEMLNVLYSQRDELNKDIEDLKRIFDRLQGRSSNFNLPQVLPIESALVEVAPPTEVPSLNPVKVSNPKNVITGTDSKFPHSEPFDKQLLYVLNREKSAQRYPELESEYKRLSGINRTIRRGLNDLRKKGLVAAIKYNGNFNQLYMGLPEWTFDSDKGTRFRDEYLNPAKFPAGIWKSELIGEDKM